jgi:hypothetical protein
VKYLFRGTYHDKKYTRLLTDGKDKNEKLGE